MEHQIRLSGKYAQAVMNVFGESISREDIAHVQEIITFLGEHKKALFFLRLSRIDLAVKERALDKLFENLSNKKPFFALVHLLVQENRGHLIYGALSELVAIYYQTHKIMACEITSSHSISAESLDKVQQFLARQTGNDIIYTYTRDASLIAGIRAQSKTVLWEYSIRKQLRELALHMASEG
jgi:F0F1-type ATP synthase delta subunit